MKKVEEAAKFIKEKIGKEVPEYAIVLGSGLGALVKEVEVEKEIEYQKIPNFPKSTVKGHGNKLILGRLAGKLVLMQTGRFHYYEGYSMKEVTFAMRVFFLLGIKKVVLSNASGGVNKNFSVGDVMIIKDHINMFPEHPLRGKNNDFFGDRFPDMSQAYDREMIEFTKEMAKEMGIEVKEGIYVGLQGPTFETPAEYGMISRLGGDVVGMSTVPEVIVARHQKMRVLAFSVISDLGGEAIALKVSHQEVLEAVDRAMPKVVTLLKRVIEKGKFE